MIADPHTHAPQPCSPSRLQRLLEESLPAEQAAQTEAHLELCQTCREQLHALAGNEGWWNETQSMLRDSTQAATGPRPQRPKPADGPLEPSLQWIQPLLQASDAENELGLLGTYPVLEIIGQGGMGVVLRGHDRELNRPVAIKVLAPHLAGVGAARQRFMREAQAAAAIVHPNVIPIYGIETDAALPYLVMPFVAGGNLQQCIDAHGAMDLEDVLRIGVQVAEGLAAAHRHGVIHRDVKPANMLVEAGNGRVLISDFGLARALDDATLTVSGMIAGTPQYMSPEQAVGDSIDARSDLFSLGSLLYALSTGRPPFRAESPLAVLRKISDGPPRPAHQINERLPPWFSRLLQSLMEIDTDHRIATADEAAELLREALQYVRQPAQARLPGRLLPSSQFRLSAVSRRWLAGLLTVLTVAMLALGVLYQPWKVYQPWKSTSPPSTQQQVPPAAVPASPPKLSSDESFDASWEAERWSKTMREVQIELDSLFTPE